MTKISTRNLEPMPSPENLERTLQAFAMLDAIICPGWEDRYHSFNIKWDKTTRMASMNNGSGDTYFVTFSSAGVFIKGFDHESSMSPHANDSGSVWPGVLEEVPSAFVRFLNEPAFEMDDMTFCIWNLATDPGWRVGKINFPAHKGNDPDGSSNLLQLFEGKPKLYRTWAEDYFEVELPLKSVQKVFAFEPLTNELIESINPDVTLKDLKKDIAEIGYLILKGSV